MAVDFFILGQHIQQRRKKLNMTQEKMAELLNVSVGYVSQVERGITKLSLDTLANFAGYLKCEIYDLLTGTSEQTDSFLSKELENVIISLSSQNKKILFNIAQVLANSQTN